jgi:hypothetical protein
MAHAPSHVRVHVQPSDCGGQVAHAKETLEAQQRRHLRPDGADSAYHSILGEAELGPMRPPGTRPSTVAGATRTRSVRAGAHAEVPHALGEQLGAPGRIRGFVSALRGVACRVVGACRMLSCAPYRPWLPRFAVPYAPLPEGWW